MGKISKVKIPDQFCSAWHFPGAYSRSESWSPLESQPGECLPRQAGDLRGSCCSLPPATLPLPLWHCLRVLGSFLLDQIGNKYKENSLLKYGFVSSGSVPWCNQRLTLSWWGQWERNCCGASCTSAWSLEEPWNATLLSKHIIGPTNWFCPNTFAIPVQTHIDSLLGSVRLFFRAPSSPHSDEFFNWGYCTLPSRGVLRPLLHLEITKGETRACY